MASVAEPLESFKKAKKTNITLVICKVSSIYEVKYDPKTIVINNYLPTVKFSELKISCLDATHPFWPERRQIVPRRKFLFLNKQHLCLEVLKSLKNILKQKKINENIFLCFYFLIHSPFRNLSNNFLNCDKIYKHKIFWDLNFL